MSTNELDTSNVSFAESPPGALTLSAPTPSAPTPMTVDQSSPGVASLRVEVVNNVASLGALRDVWNSLVDDNPMNRWEWVETWWRHYHEKNDRLHVLTVHDINDTIVGIAPLYVSPTRWFGRHLLFLGSGDVCTDYANILTADGCEAAVANAIAGHLAETADKVWDLVELTGVAADAPTIAQLCTRSAAVGLTHHVSPLANCWRLEFPPTWEAYVATLSRSRRGRVRKLIRGGLDTDRVVLKVADSTAELEQGYEILKDLHERRRNSMGQRGYFARERYAAFHHEILHTYHSQGRARLFWLEIDGQPIAVEYDLVGDDVISLYQSGMNPDMAAERPGWLCVIAALRSAQQQGHSAFDFLRGDEPYKAHWRAKPCPIVKVHIVANGLAARWRYRALVNKTRLRSLARQCLVKIGLKKPAQ